MLFTYRDDEAWSEWWARRQQSKDCRDNGNDAVNDKPSEEQRSP